MTVWRLARVVAPWAIVLSLVSDCGLQPAAPAPGTLRLGWRGSPDALNPGTAMLAEAYTLFELVYDSLYERRLDGTFALSLADSVATSADGLTWTFRLRPGVRFHDGHPLTAEDVAYSCELYRRHADFPYLNTYTRSFAETTALDSQTVQLRLERPVPDLPSRLVFLYVLPAHVWRAAIADSDATLFANQDMVGSGPFRMSGYRQNEFVHLVANSAHFATPPRIRELILQTYHNQDALVQALRTGQLDVITELPATAVPKLRQVPQVTVVVGTPLAPEVTDIAINQVQPADCPRDQGGRCTGHPALRDAAVRRALGEAMDPQALVDVALMGLGRRGKTLIPDGLGAWFNTQLPDRGGQLAQAAARLEAAGYRDRDGDGIREMPDGSQSLVFRLHWPNDIAEAPRVAQLLARWWRAIGIDTRLQAVDPEALTAQCCPAFDYDLMLWSWDSDPDPDLLLSVMTTAQIPTGTSETGYSSPRYDSLYAAQASELDRQHRQDLVWQMQQLAFDDAVYLIPYYAQARQAYRTDRFRGWIIDQPRLALEDVSSLVHVEPLF